MSQIQFSFAVALVLALVQTATGRPPNLVFILTDNQGAWTLGCYGNPDIRTPNIDRLAAEGIRFTRALSSNPVCSPTRYSIQTGKYPTRAGLTNYLPGVRTERFQEAPLTRERAS